MSGKNLTFKLILDGDSKGLVAAAKQSEDVTKKVFETIKSESDKVKQVAESSSKAIGNIVPKGTTELADKLSQSLTAATGIIQDAGDNAKSTAGNFTDFGNKAEKALGQLKSDLVEAKRNLEAFSKTDATPADMAVAQAQVDQLEKEVKQADQAFNDFHAEVGRANTNLKETDNAAQTAQKGIAGLKTGYTALVGVMGALGVGLGIKELAEAADSYTNLSARINIATSEGGNFQHAMAGVHQVALATNTSLDTTAGLFTKVNDVGKQMGLTQQQTLDLTKTINMAIQTGGGSAASADAAITQLTQALQSGVLRGDEFNSIMEQAPGISKALAQSLGVTTSELRKMAENGELSAEKVISALQKQSAAIEADYAKFPTTIGNALQRIQTQWQALIGTMDQSTGASATVAQWLVTLADNMGIVEILLKDIGSGFIWVGDQLSFIDVSIFESLKSALSSAYDAVKDVISTLVDFGKTIVDILGTSLTSALAILSSFTGEATAASEQVGFLERVLQGLSIAFGFIADGATAIKISVNLLAGAFFDLASAANSVMAAVTWGDVSKQFAANADTMKAKAKQYYAEADKDAMAFESKGLKRIEEAAQTQDEKNAAQITNNQQTLEQLKTQEDEHLANHKDNIEQRLILEKKLAEARKSNNVEVINAVLKEISAIDKAEEKAIHDRIQRDKEKLDSARALAEASIKSNDGVLSNLVKEDLLRLGIIAKINEQGQLEVVHHENSSQLNAERMAKLKALSEQEGKLNQDRIVDSQEVGKSVVHDEEYIASERIRLNEAANRAKRSGDFEAYSQAKLAIDNLKNAHVQADQERTNQYQESSNAIQQIDSSTFELQKNHSEEQVRLSKVAAQAKKDGDFEAYSQAMLQIDSLSASEVQASQKVSQSDLETLRKKEDITRQKVALAQQIIESTNGIITEEQKLQFEAQGLTVEYDEMGKAVVRQKASLSSAAKALGIDLSQSLNLVSTEFTETEKSLDAFAAGLKGLGIEGKQAADLTYEAWLKWLETAKSQAEIDAANAKLREFEAQGVFSTKQVELGIRAIQRANAELPDELDETGKAFERLGIKTKEQLKLSAQMALADFETVRKSGQATQADLQKAYEETIRLAYASGDAQAIAAANSKAASLGLKVQVDETGKASVKSMSDLEQSVHRVRNATSGAEGGFRDLGQTARDEAQSAGDAWQEAIEKSREEFAARGKGESGRAGASYTSYSRSSVLAELKGMGYSDKEAQKLASSIMSNAFAADASAAQRNYATGNAKLLNAGFEKNRAQGLTSAFGSEVVQKALNNLANGSGLSSTGPSTPTPSAPSLPSSPSARESQGGKTVNYNLSFGGQTLSFTGSADQEPLMNQLVEQLKKQAKST